MNTKEIFKNLEGYWSFEREVLDMGTMTTDFALGQASFIKANNIEDNHLEYEEIGTLSLSRNLKKIKFSRKYIYQLYDEAITIILNDGLTKGKVFQTLSSVNNDNSFTGSEHICRTDKHGGQYHFLNSDEFKIIHTVKGLGKNLRIKSSFKRISS